MKQSDAVKIFIEAILPSLDKTDIPAIRQSFSMFIDSLAKDGQLSIAQAHKIQLPGKFQKSLRFKGFNKVVDEYENQSHEERELLLYIENDGDLYRQQFMPIIKNIQRKIKARKYDHKLAPKLWLYLVENGAKKYAKEFATPKEWSKIFSPIVRKKVASYMANEYYEKIKAGEYN